jgi:hypothetical protein
MPQLSMNTFAGSVESPMCVAAAAFGLGNLTAEVMDHGRELHREAQAERLREFPRERDAFRDTSGGATVERARRRARSGWRRSW